MIIWRTGSATAPPVIVILAWPGSSAVEAMVRQVVREELEARFGPKVCERHHDEADGPGGHGRQPYPAAQHSQPAVPRSRSSGAGAGHGARTYAAVRPGPDVAPNGPGFGERPIW